MFLRIIRAKSKTSYILFSLFDDYLPCYFFPEEGGSKFHEVYVSYQTTRYHVPEDSHRFENLKSNLIVLFNKLHMDK